MASGCCQGILLILQAETTTAAAAAKEAIIASSSTTTADAQLADDGGGGRAVNPIDIDFYLTIFFSCRTLNPLLNGNTLVNTLLASKNT